MSVGWPEGILLGLIAFNLSVAAIRDGQPRTDHWRFGVKLIDASIMVSLLWWGGFFA